MAAITDPVEVGALLRAIDAFRGTLIVQSALKLSALVFVRPSELRQAEWSEIDLEKGEWNIPARRMKGWTRKGITTPHLVPLAPQAVAILQDLQPLTGRGLHVFAGRDPRKPMSEAAVNAALRRMGYDTKTEMTGHGFRAMARTILHEELGPRRPRCLGHSLQPNEVHQGPAPDDGSVGGLSGAAQGWGCGDRTE
jgi:integrase